MTWLAGQDGFFTKGLLLSDREHFIFRWEFILNRLSRPKMTSLGEVFISPAKQKLPIAYTTHESDPSESESLMMYYLMFYTQQSSFLNGFPV